MQEKLSALAAHLTEVEQQLADPAVYTDREKLTALRREQKELTPVVECWQAYLRAQDTAREAEEMEFSIDPKDLQIDTFRSSGAGGQHVNKTESAIRITHLPTGVVVECQDERSQYKNKDRAMKILRSKLYEAEQEKQNAAIAATRKSQVGTGDRSGKIRTYNFPQNRVTDHRLTGDNKNFNIAAIINGDLDGMIDALTLNDQAQRLQEGKES